MFFSQSQASRIDLVGERLDSNYGDYLRLIKSRLQNDKFELQERQNVDGYDVDFIGYKLFFSKVRINYRAFCQIAFLDPVSPETVRKFAEATYEFGMNYKKPFGTYTFRSYPVIASLKFSEEAKSYVRTYKGRHFQYDRWYIDHPVLAELRSSSIFHNEKVGVLGAFPQKGAIDAARNYFSFEK
jgi:hypothetical protein